MFNNLISIIFLVASPILTENHIYDTIEHAKDNIDEKVLIGPEYFPIDPSLNLYYNSSLGEATATIKVEGDNFILNLSNDDFYFIQTVHVKNDSILLTKLEQEIDVFLFISSTVDVTYSRPYLRFPFPLTNNDSWNWTGVEYINEGDPDSISVSGKVIGKELLTTEAGTFDCVKFQIDIRKKQRGSHTKFYEWRAPGIGLVRLEAFIDSKGFIGTVMSLLGYDEMVFELKKVG